MLRRTKGIRLLALLVLAACAPSNRVSGPEPEATTRAIPHAGDSPSTKKATAKDLYVKRQNEADAAGPRVVETPEAAQRVGTVLTHRFHRVDCKRLAGVPTAEQIRFTTSYDALDNGYRPCEDCAPMR